MYKNDPKQIINDEVTEFVGMESELATVENELMGNPTFKRFMELRQTIAEAEKDLRARIEVYMIENQIKKHEVNGVSLTIGERIDFDVDTETLPSKFIKKVPDLTKIRDTYRLEGKAPKGTEPKIKNYLIMKLKKEKK